MAKANPDVVRLALETARDHGFEEIEIESDGVKFKARLERRAPAPTVVISQPATFAEESPKETSDELPITAPCVGFFQETKPPLEIGRAVSIGEIVASIQALGIANEVESLLSGEITEVLVRTGDPVEFGQPIARVKVTA